MEVLKANLDEVRGRDGADRGRGGSARAARSKARRWHPRWRAARKAPDRGAREGRGHPWPPGRQRRGANPPAALGHPSLSALPLMVLQREATPWGWEDRPRNVVSWRVATTGC